MASAKQNRQAFTIDHKVPIIRSIESGRSKADVAREYGLPSSSVSTIWKNHDNFIRAYEKNNKSTKDHRLLSPGMSRMSIID